MLAEESFLATLCGLIISSILEGESVFMSAVFDALTQKLVLTRGAVKPRTSGRGGCQSHAVIVLSFALSGNKRCGCQ
jgi:hypothetical protein